MEKIVVEVCAGTHCTMMGAMNIMDAVASLNEIRPPMAPYCDVEVRPVKCMKLCKDGAHGPMVMVSGTLIERAESDAVMAAIIKQCEEHRKNH